MLYSTSIRKGLLIASALFLADLAASGIVTMAGLTVLGVLGDLVLVEVGVLTILGGLIEFSRSKGVYEFRRVAFHSEEQFSTTKHLEASERAIVFFSAALALFLLLILLALLE